MKAFSKAETAETGEGCRPKTIAGLGVLVLLFAASSGEDGHG